MRMIIINSILSSSWAVKNFHFSLFFLSSSTALGNLGSVLSSQGRFDEAEEALLAALKFRRNMADAHYNLWVFFPPFHYFFLAVKNRYFWESLQSTRYASSTYTYVSVTENFSSKMYWVREIYDDKVPCLMEETSMAAATDPCHQVKVVLYIEILSIVGEEIKIQSSWKGYDSPYSGWLAADFFPTLRLIHPFSCCRILLHVQSPQYNMLYKRWRRQNCWCSHIAACTVQSSLYSHIKCSAESFTFYSRKFF